MSRQSLLLICPSLTALSRPLIGAVLAHWPAAQQPPTEHRSFAQLVEDPAPLRSAGIAWIVSDLHDPLGLFDVLALLQDQQMPAMLTRPHDPAAVGEPFEAGIILGPAGASPAALCAALRALHSQVANFHELRRQIAILQNQQRGLAGEMDKIDEELRLASQLQHEFLPARLPAVQGVEFAALYRPASYVSGDVYDVARLDEDHVGLFVADAVGHGVPAALMTVYLKQSLATKEMDRIVSDRYRLIPPEEAIGRLNRDLMAKQNGKVRTATAWYGLMNCRTRELRYARAGHPLPLLLRADGSMGALESEGALLGVFPEEAFEARTLTLLPGDRLLLYSDGFETAFRKANADGSRQSLASNQYVEEFKDLRHGPIDQAIQRLIANLDAQAGSLHQLDDITAVCMGVGPDRIAA